MTHAEAATSIGQTNTTSNTCGVDAGPVGCVNAGISTTSITPSVATQSIDITGTQNIEETNQCNDNAGNTCFNGGFGPIPQPVNSFNLTHDKAADVKVDMFVEDITQKNICKFFQACTNSGANDFTITAEDDDGVAATDFDIIVRPSSQIVNQTNTCEGDLASTANPLCNNVVGVNSIKISALVDGDVKLGPSTQEVLQLNNCGPGEVVCNNQGFNELGSDRFGSRGLVANGETAKTDLGTNTQTVGQDNECSLAGTACENFGLGIVGLDSQGNSSTTLSDNTQKMDAQTNDCSNTGGLEGEATTCSNFGINLVDLNSFDNGTIAISASAQATSQSNSCDNIGIFRTQCSNNVENSLSVTASGNGSLVGNNRQTAIQLNKCSDAFCSNELGGAANFFLVGTDGIVKSVNTQSNEKFNNCTQTTCINVGAPGNFIVVDGASSVDSTNDQRMTQTNDGCLPICANSVFLLNDIVASDNSSVTSTNTQSIEQSNTNCVFPCSNSASSINTASAVGNSSIVLRTDQTTHQTNTCEFGCFNDGSNFIGVSTDDNDRVSASITQSNTGSTNCSGASSCQNIMSNSAILEPGSSLDKEGTTSRVTLHQLGEQEDKCTFGSSCSSSASNSATVEINGNGGDENIDQQSVQENHCRFSSTCSNIASTSATIDGSSPDGDIEIKQNIDQKNLCVKDSACSNTGSVADGSGSNTQSNTCIDGSTCNNSGENNKTVCIGSANCENSGTDTKVISKGEDCSSGDPGSTTVCANGRTIPG